MITEPVEQDGVIVLAIGDIVKKIDGHKLSSEMGEKDIQLLLQKKSNEPITVVAKSIDDETTKTAMIPVKKMPLETIAEAEEWPVELSYIKLNGIFDDSAKDIIPVLREWGESDRFGVIIDLRDADGTDLNSAAEIASLFAEGDTVLFTVKDPSRTINTYKAHHGHPSRDAGNDANE